MMNVFEENESLRQEVVDLRADLEAAESRLQQPHAAVPADRRSQAYSRTSSSRTRRNAGPSGR
jgi:cell division septum initiation protein DivIVA